MPKFDKMRTMLASGQLQWTQQQITCAIVKDYTFDATDATMQDIQAGGGVILATRKLSGKLVTTTGYAQSAAVQMTMIPAGTDYSVILFSDVNSVVSPLVEFPDAVDVAATGNILVRPEGSVDDAPGTWFRF